MGNLSTSKDTDRNRARMFLDVINVPEKKGEERRCRSALEKIGELT